MARRAAVLGLAGAWLCFMNPAGAGAALPLNISVNAELGGAAVRLDGAAAAVPTVKAVQLPVRGPGHEFSARLDAVVRRLQAEHPEIPQAAVMKAFRYLWSRADSVANKEYVAIVDFDRPSSERRLSLIRLSDGSVAAYLVAHGKGSGGLYATRFSDTPRTHQSALGIYLTGDDYQGEHGRSLKLYGMEPGNDRAAARAIVMHSADYVTDRYVAAHGMAGRSWGCPAVDPAHRERIMDALQGGAVLLLHHSSAR